MNFFKLKLWLICFFLLYVIFWQTASAINCKKANLSWEKEICKNSDLMRLDKEMNETYQKCMSLDNAKEIKKSQKKWLNSLVIQSLDNEINLEDIYTKQLTQLKKIYFDKKMKSYTSPIIKNPFFQYQWIKIVVDNHLMFRYPLLLNLENKPGITFINSQLEKIAKKYISEAKERYACDNSYDDFNINNEIDKEILKAHLFGFTIEYDDNCCVGCHYPFERSYTYMWDIDTGRNIQDALENPFSVESESNQEISLWNLARIDNKAIFEDYCHHTCFWKFGIGDNGIEVTLYDGADHVIDGAIVNAIEYSKIKAAIQINPLFLAYLPQLIKAGLVNKKIGNQILQIEKSSGNSSEKILQNLPLPYEFHGLTQVNIDGSG